MAGSWWGNLFSEWGRRLNGGAGNGPTPELDPKFLTIEEIQKSRIAEDHGQDIKLKRHWSCFMILVIATLVLLQYGLLFGVGFVNPKSLTYRILEYGADHKYLVEAVIVTNFTSLVLLVRIILKYLFSKDAHRS